MYWIVSMYTTRMKTRRSSTITVPIFRNGPEPRTRSKYSEEMYRKLVLM